MGIHIKTASDGKIVYIYSSTTGKIIGKHTSMKDAAIQVAKREVFKAKLDAIRILLTFPQNYIVDGMRQTKSTPEQKSEYEDWSNFIKTIHNTDMCETIVDNKLQELLQTIK